MSEQRDNLEFVIFGQKLRFRSESTQSSEISPSDIVQWVYKEADNIRKSASGLDESKLAVLTLMKIAGDYLELKSKGQKILSKIDMKTKSILEECAQAK